MVLKKGGDISAFEKALDQAVGQRAEVKSLVSKRSLEIRDLDKTVTREEFVAICHAAAHFQAGWMPAGGVGARLRSARLPLDA